MQLENDRFSNTDRHYTHGTRVAWVSAKDDVPHWAKVVMGWVTPPWVTSVDRTKHRIGYVFGQDIFTPEDISREDLILDDRPYAGWLCVGLSLHVETDSQLDSVELDVGLVGPESFAEDIQTIVHEMINVQRPNGWDHQLQNEPGLVLTMDRRWRFEPLTLGPLEADVIPAIGVSLGNVRTHASVGSILRIGQSLDLDFGPPQIRPSLSAAPAFDAPKFIGWYLFGGAEARWVVWNIFLDGNTFTESHDVSKKPVVGSLQFGGTIAYRRVRLTFTQVLRTKEFDGQSDPDRFGTVALSVNF